MWNHLNEDKDQYTEKSMMMQFYQTAKNLKKATNSEEDLQNINFMV